MAGAGTLLLGACDAGPFHNDVPAVGPAVQVITDGTNIGPGQTFTIDQPIRIAFNRFLDPSTVLRQSLLLETAGGSLVADALVAYDPVSLTVTLSNPGAMEGWLVAGQDYKVVLSVPTASFPYGLAAIDGANLAATQTISFTANAAANPPATGEPVMSFCSDVLPIFSPAGEQPGAGCAGCHAAPFATSNGNLTAPPDGLILSTAQGVASTAVGQVAIESNTGPLAAPESLSGPFGVNMPIIAAGQPANSWLLYKTLLATPSSGTFDPGTSVPMFETSDPRRRARGAERRSRDSPELHPWQRDAVPRRRRGANGRSQRPRARGAARVDRARRDVGPEPLSGERSLTRL